MESPLSLSLGTLSNILYPSGCEGGRSSKRGFYGLEVFVPCNSQGAEPTSRVPVGRRGLLRGAARPQVVRLCC